MSAISESLSAGNLEYSNDEWYSGIKHMEEIREAGLEMPVVNQIEVLLDPLHVPETSQRRS